MFTDLANPFGTAAFEKVAYPMADLAHYKPVPVKAKRTFRMPRAPKPPSHHAKNFLLTF